jgi:hypothetical protein
VYTDFYESVDVVGVDVAAGFPVYGLLARVTDIATEPNSPTTTGYTFGYVPLGVLGGANYVAIARLSNGGINGISGSGSGANAQFPITLAPGSSYRLVFMGHGPNMEGRVYSLPTLTLLAVVTGSDNRNTEGNGGLLAFNLAANPVTGAASQYAGGANVTYDNYYAATNCPLNVADMVVTDNFNDGNDTAPTLQWTEYDPISTYPPFGGGFPQNTWSFPGGNTYRLEAAVSPDPALGNSRVSSAAPGSQSNFRVAADIVAWGENNQDIGLFGRVAGPIGLGTSTGYVFTHNVTGGDTDISRITGEAPTEITPGHTGNDAIVLEPGHSYRFVFSGQGSLLRGMVFELPTMVPVVDISATDTTYPAGVNGLVASGHNTSQPADATYDNYSDTAYIAPAVSLTVGATVDGKVTVSWPYNPDCLWVLESCPDLTVPVWTEVAVGSNPTQGHLVIAPGTFTTTYTANSPMSSAGNTYYRLKQL